MLIVVADDEGGRLIAATLNRAPYQVRVEPTAIAAIETMRGWLPHLVIMHIDAGTARLLAELSEDPTFRTLPIIGLSRHEELAMTVAALDAGVDDVVTEPVAGEELRAHIRALVRRRYGPYQTVPALRLGVLEINLVERCVRAGEVRIHLTSLEQALLYLLAATPGTVISRNAILDALWGIDFAPENNTLERHVSRLRAKLRKDLPDTYRIETVRGQGYRLMPPKG